MQRYVIAVAAVMYFAFVIAFLAVPCPCDELEVIVYTTYDMSDLQPTQAAEIGDPLVAFANFALCHGVTS